MVDGNSKRAPSSLLAWITGAVCICAAVSMIAWPLFHAVVRLSKTVVPTTTTLTQDAGIYIILHAAVAFLGLILLGVLQSQKVRGTGPQAVDAVSSGGRGGRGSDERTLSPTEERPREEETTEGDESGHG